MVKNEASFPVRKTNWVNIFFFSITALLGVIGTPIYLYRFGISTSEILLFFFYLIIAPLSITSGYHRLFAHVTYQANALVRFLFLFFGAAAYEQSALKWASQHRDHHRYVDTDRDPYSIKKGFFHAHMGWFLFWERPIHYENVKDLQKSRLISHQHRYYRIWSLTSGILLPLFIGALTGHLIGALLLSVCLRLAIVHHVTFCINSVCHTFGKATFDIYSSAKDHWATALMTYGEGYHNFHHHFPADYRNGVRWYQWDPTKWLITLLEKAGFAWDLKRVSRFRILAAKLTAENQRICDQLKTDQYIPNLQTIITLVNTQYEKLRQALGDWERSVKECQDLLSKQIAHHSDVIYQEALYRMRESRSRFRHSLSMWHSLPLKRLALA